MKITIEQNGLTLKFSGEIGFEEVARLELDSLDQRLMAECSSATLPAADYLLCLEMIFRRAQMQGLKVESVFRVTP